MAQTMQLKWGDIDQCESVCDSGRWSSTIHNPWILHVFYLRHFSNILQYFLQATVMIISGPSDRTPKHWRVVILDLKIHLRREHGKQCQSPQEEWLST